MNKEILKQKRLDLNLTQKQLAEKVNISERYYQSLEYGDQNPSTKLALRLSEILGVSLDELFPRQP